MPPRRRRTEVATRIAELVGPEVLTLTDLASGWPAYGTLNATDAPGLSIALYSGPIGTTGRGRDDTERRFQNVTGGKAILPEEGLIPVLMGIWEGDELISPLRPVLVLANPGIRFGHTTRFSVFQRLSQLEEAVATGWAEGTNDTGERMLYFLPPLLPTALTTYLEDLDLDPGQVQKIIDGSGINDDATPAAQQRARRATTTLARDARFSRNVLYAYGGICAMCGIGEPLIQGAHIYPASAPESRDEVWNGLALCASHHLLFDRHLIAVAPDNYRILIHTGFAATIASSDAGQRLLESTRKHLALPSDAVLRPRPEMINMRRAFYFDSYTWLSS